MCVGVLSLCMIVCGTHACSAHRGLKLASGHLGLESQMGASCMQTLRMEPGPLEEWSVFLTAELFPHPYYWFL